MRATTLLLLWLFSWPSFAGYYATVTSSSLSSVPVGSVSACSLLPSITASVLTPNLARTITAINGDTSSGTYTASTSTGSFTASYAYCVGIGLGGALPTFPPGINDPAINLNTGLVSSGSSTSNPISVTAKVVQPEIAFLDPAQAVGNSVQWFGFTALLWSLAWGGRRVYDLFTHST